MAPYAYEGAFTLTHDVLNNRLVLATESRDALLAFARGKGLQIPDDVAIEHRDQHLVTTADLYAGLTLTNSSGAFQCTSGFSVRSGSTLGVATAAHCINSLYYLGGSIPFVSPAAYGGSHDEQWHTSGGNTIRNLAFDGEGSSPYRTITAKYSRGNQALNSLYCKYGRSTQYDCGYLISKTIVGAMPNAIATSMRLHRDGVDLSSPGDSGGPVYTANGALGIIHACISTDPQCDDSTLKDDMVYVASNYVESGLGVLILTSAP